VALIERWAAQLAVVEAESKAGTKALDELKQLTGTSEQPLSPKQELLQDLQHLENVVEAKLAELREKIEHLN